MPRKKLPKATATPHVPAEPEAEQPQQPDEFGPGPEVMVCHAVINDEGEICAFETGVRLYDGRPLCPQHRDELGYSEADAEGGEPAEPNPFEGEPSTHSVGVPETGPLDMGTGEDGEQPVGDEFLQSIRPAIAELERFAAFSNVWYNLGIQAKTVITIQKGGKRNIVGHFKTDAWSTREGDSVHEVSINAEDLHRSPVELFATVQHMLAHAVNYQNGVKDGSDAGRHNAAFKAQAEAMGLALPDKPHGARGFYETAPDDEFRRVVEQHFQPDHAALMLFRNVEPTRTAGSKLIKWVCPNGDVDPDSNRPIQVRGGARPFVKCGVCDELLVKDAPAVTDSEG